MSDEVRKRSAAVQEMAAHWPMIDALLGGTSTMRAAGEAHLPKWPNEDSASHATRLASATLFPAFARTVDVLSAKPFSKPLTQSEDTPARIKEWCDDIDLQGRNLHVFAADVVEEAMSHGLSGILVEYPRASGVKTQAEEENAGVRPYFVHIHPGQILGWRAQCVSGMWMLTQLRLLETVTEDEGPFSERQIEQVRVLTPGAFQIWRKAAGDGAAWFMSEEGKTTLKVVPFVPFYGQREGFMKARPPLLDLAFQNVKHWQSQSDQDTIMHVARVPILFATGMPDETVITVGASSAIKCTSKDANLKFVEHTGAAIEAGAKSLDRLEDQMRQTGAELLVIKPGGTSVPQTLADNEPGRCTLQRITEDAEDGFDAALQLMADWVGEPSGGSVNLFDDFGVETLAEASADLLLKANTAGKISDETLFEEMKRRGLVGPERSWADEKERIDQQGPALGAIPPAAVPPGE